MWPVPVGFQVEVSVLLVGLRIMCLDSFSIGDLQSRVAHVPMIANILCWRCWRYKLLARHP